MKNLVILKKICHFFKRSRSNPHTGAYRGHTFGGSRGAEPPWWGVWGAKPPSETQTRPSNIRYSIKYPIFHQISNIPSNIRYSIKYPTFHQFSDIPSDIRYSIKYLRFHQTSKIENLRFRTYPKSKIQLFHPRFDSDPKFLHPPSLEASSCLGGNHEVKSILRTF